MGRAKSTPRISAPSAAPVGIISIDIGGSSVGRAALSPCKLATPRAAYPIHIPRAPPASVPGPSVWLARKGSDHTADGGSDPSRTTQGVADLARNWKFESISLQRGVNCEPDFHRTR